jgi:membrane-bound lytic murein transglycosylase D
MEIMSKGGIRRGQIATALLPLLFAVSFLAGCARVSSTPVVNSPAAVPPPATETTASAEPQPVAASPSAEQAAAEVATAEDETQPAEEVTPSPLDEIPETPPAVSSSTLEKDKNLAAEDVIAFDIPMVLNDQVFAYVEYFKHPHKELFAASLVRSGRYVAAFRTAFEAAGLPKDLVYMAHVESAFKTNAFSRAKAKGIFQFIAETGRRYGLRIDSWVDERSDPEKSARAAAAYLKDLYGMFGDWYLALAAYNAGEGKIERSIAKMKTSDFWQLASTRSLRAETKNYVPAILAATLIAKQPQKYDFDVRFDEPVASDVIKIEGQTDLRVLARVAELDVETLRALNPQLRRGMTPPGSTTDVRVPSGLGEAVTAAYAKLPAGDRLVLARHEVEKGESLGAIANANRLGKGGAVRPGQSLVIPAVAPPSNDSTGSRTGATTYRVRKGDTLYEIASHYRTTPAAIASASGIGIHSNLIVGQRLTVPGKGGSSRAPVAATHSERAAVSSLVHTVQRGETLYRIADHYQVTVDQICTLNRITPDGVLYPGTRLTIRSTN